jgi:hypothetical protein
MNNSILAEKASGRDAVSRVRGYLAQSINPGSPLRRGRSVKDGYARGWGLQFGRLREQIRRDPLYLAGLSAGDGRSVMAEDNRLNIFLILTAYLVDLPAGDVIEYGTFRGGNALFMATILAEVRPGARVYALDTFAGMPPTDGEIDAHSAGDFADVDLEALQAHATGLGLDNLHFIKGRFEDTAPRVLAEAGRISLAHIDCDIYSAVKYAYDISISHMVPGGYYVFDDATFSSCIGATEAVEESVIQRDRLFSEQIFPHFVFRHPLT